VRYTPAALGRARALGIDPSNLPPGPDGVVGLREIERAAAASLPHVPTAPHVPAEPGIPPAPAAPAVRASAGRDPMRAAIAAAMSRAWREIPHYSVSSTLDLEPLLGWLEGYNAGRPVPERLHYAAALAKAVALALKAAPALNGHVLAEGFVPSPSVHLGIAVALRGGGLVAPAILDADTLPLPALMAHLGELVERVRGGRLRSSELDRATATLTNLGEHTADAVQPIIHPPQVAMVGCGQVVERAWAEHGALSARRCMTVTVAGDHRVSDGRVAARFLDTLAMLLRQPEQL
jgi:pyruvate dehydrogenase E2 component (dihydrolipoamide acetyltransferase)